MPVYNAFGPDLTKFKGVLSPDDALPQFADSQRAAEALHGYMEQFKNCPVVPCIIALIKPIDDDGLAAFAEEHRFDLEDWSGAQLVASNDALRAKLIEAGYDGYHDVSVVETIAPLQTVAFNTAYVFFTQ